MDYSPPSFSAMEFSRQMYWSGLPFSSPGDLPDSAWQADSLLLRPLGSLFPISHPLTILKVNSKQGSFPPIACHITRAPVVKVCL